MGQTHPKPETHSKPNSDKSKSDPYLFTDLQPAPRTYTDEFWRKTDWFSDRDIEALIQFRQLELELLESDDEKESKIGEFCKKYCSARIPLDVDKFGYPRGLFLSGPAAYDIYDEELKEHETLIVRIGLEDSDALMYLGGSGKLYMSLNDGLLKVLYNYRDVFQI